MHLWKRLSMAIDKSKEKRRALEIAEKQRIETIRQGRMSEVTTANINFGKTEKAYYLLNVARYADMPVLQVDNNIKTKKSGVLSGALIGGMAGGMAGAEIGASLMARDQSKTTTNIISSTQAKLMSKGQMVFTNKRVLYIGREVVSVPYKELLRIEIFPGRTHHTITLLRENMTQGEFYLSFDKKRTDILYYLEGVARLNNSSLKLYDERLDNQAPK